MPQRHWHLTPRQSIERERDRRGELALVRGCCRMLDGDDADPALLLALGGPHAQRLIDQGLPDGQRYWLRVWAARGLLWVWHPEAEESLVEAAGDEQWRVRELAAKVTARHRVAAALPVVRALAEDGTPRVRAAALRALAELEG